MDFNKIFKQEKEINCFWFLSDQELVNELDLKISYVMFLYWYKTNDAWLSASFIQTAIITLWSIVEAILYEYVFEYLTKNDPKKLKRYCKNFQYIEKHITNWILMDNLVICEKVEKEFDLKDDISFNALINWVKDYKLLSPETISYLSEIREKRNIVHLKVLVKFKELDKEIENFANSLDKYAIIFNEIKEEFNKLNTK